MKKLNFAIVALLSVMLFACQQDELVQNDQTEVTALSGEDIHVCTFDFHNQDLLDPDNSLRAALVKSNKWVNGSTIRVKFLNGDSFLQEKVKKYVREWSGYVNLKFEFVSASANADIKVAFKWNGDTGSWSYIGNYCQTIPQNAPSMNFGWFDVNTPEAEFSRTILHEFGHALGLIHEHQHPLNGILWNKEYIYNYYELTQGWDRSKVDTNMFRKYTTTQTNYSSYDTYSIMHYYFPPEFTTNGFSAPLNNYLSHTDKTFIKQQYPGPAFNVTVTGFPNPFRIPDDLNRDIRLVFTPQSGTTVVDYNYMGGYDIRGQGTPNLTIKIGSPVTHNVVAKLTNSYGNVVTVQIDIQYVNGKTSFVVKTTVS